VRAWHERRQEERQALDMVRVRVADEQVRAYRTAARERDPELPCAGTAVEDEERAVVGAGFDAWRIPTVARGLRTGCGDGSPDPPEADVD
jgi:hypothetical protein